MENTLDPITYQMTEKEKTELRKKAQEIGRKIDAKQEPSDADIDTLCDWVILEIEELND